MSDSSLMKSLLRCLKRSSTFLRCWCRTQTNNNANVLNRICSLHRKEFWVTNRVLTRQCYFRRLGWVCKYRVEVYVWSSLWCQTQRSSGVTRILYQHVKNLFTESCVTYIVPTFQVYCRGWGLVEWYGSW